MKLRISGLLAIAAVAGLLGSAQALAQNAYITNSFDNNVSVIDTATNTVIGSPIAVGNLPLAWRSLRTAARSMSPTNSPTQYR
jgi:YVTN family beta-propeller protein